MTRGAPVVDPFHFGTATTAGYQGVVTAVPELPAAALLAVGAALLSLRLRRARRPVQP